MPTRRRWLWLGGGLVVVHLFLFVLVVGPWLFTRQARQSLTPEQELKAENDVRTTLVQALGGLAIAGGLIVTYRSFRQNRDEQNRSYLLRQAEQMNASYTTAVEQLGHDKAPVRLGALYSLENLAQVNVHQRQTVVDVLCSYLRMPFDHQHPNADGSKNTDTGDPGAAEELQVRLTAQRRLAAHLRPPNTAGADVHQLQPSPTAPFWPGMNLDLTGATLVDLDFRGASIMRADFDRATFAGDTSFELATFAEEAGFHGTTFHGTVGFGMATFAGPARFTDMKFTGGFFDKAAFDGATFALETTFREVTFAVPVTFVDVRFDANVMFHRVRFDRDATFDKATFTGGVWFHRVIFDLKANFKAATFTKEAWFGEATLSDTDPFFALILNLDDPTLRSHRLLPNTWAVITDPRDPTRGRLVDGENYESEEDAIRAIRQQEEENRSPGGVLG